MNSARMHNEQQLVIRKGRLITPSLHDGYLLGLIAPGDQHLLVLMKDTAQVTYCLMLSGVERCRADDFWEGNIILDITIEEGNAVNIEDVADVLAVGADDPFLHKTMHRVCTEKLLLVRINPSYGCALVVLCQAVELAKDWTGILSRC